MKNNTGLFDSIYDVVFQIPPGKVATYGQIARIVFPPCDPRMVGWALASLGNRKMELPVPWHRVLGRGGRISLPGSEQRELLEREGIVFDENGRIDLERFGWEGLETPT
jgi:methylated-DNA-protein-cysteine methyltransferase-like protein